MEKKKKLYVWIVELESNVDGEVYFMTIPCSTKKKAKAILKQEKERVLLESSHFKGFTDEEFKENFEVEETEESYLLIDPCDDYYESYTIHKREVV